MYVVCVYQLEDEMVEAGYLSLGSRIKLYLYLSSADIERMLFIFGFASSLVPH